MNAVRSSGSPPNTAASLKAVTTELDLICQRHYKQSLPDLLSNVETPKGRRQYARLLGVMLKEPFSIEVKRKPSESTGAVIALKWKDDVEIRKMASMRGN